ncbi:MAG: ATP-binding cassette domain-containing protein, partial [Devosiaceae bacterium]|nr:ATP-binding cassette domain-containing protein [Devosiaceae bacterium]
MNSQFPNQVKHSTQFAGYTEAAPMISSHGLSKTFKRRTGEVQAVRGVDLQVFKGEIVGFLGPNGAGKSVTMKMLCTLLNPGGGSASIAGFDLQTEQNEIKRHIGYISQCGSTSDEARAGDEIMWQARLYGIAKSTAHER